MKSDADDHLEHFELAMADEQQRPDLIEELRWQKRYTNGRVPYTMERAAKEIERLRAENRRLHDAVVAYLEFLKKSVNVGPLTKNPSKEAALLRRLQELTGC